MKRGLQGEVPEQRGKRSALNVRRTSSASTSALQRGDCEVALSEISLNDSGS
jgi:hypothetical protein